jgi:hypothetical protein
MRNVWAIGDLTGEPIRAHRAMALESPDGFVRAGACAAYLALSSHSREASPHPLGCLAPGLLFYTQYGVVEAGLAELIAKSAVSPRGISASSYEFRSGSEADDLPAVMHCAWCSDR